MGNLDTWISCCVVQSLSCVWLFATSWIEVCQASLSFTISQSLLKLMSIDLVMLSTHLILHCSLLFLPSVFLRISFWTAIKVHILPHTYLPFNQESLSDIERCPVVRPFTLWIIQMRKIFPNIKGNNHTSHSWYKMMSIKKNDKLFLFQLAR